MPVPEMKEEQLTDHDREMLRVAEQGDPNDPSEQKPAPETETEGNPDEGEKEDFELPEGFESFEELVEAAKKGREAKPDGEGEEDAESEEGSEEQTEEGLSEAESELRELKVYEAVGGRENYGKMIEFARDNLTDDQAAVYDAAVNGKDGEIAMFATQALSAMYELHNLKTFGQEGEVTMPSAASGGSQGYSNYSEMMADMSDPRYQSDPMFNQQVVERIARSSF